MRARLNTRSWLGRLSLLLFAVHGSAAFAQALEPRSFTNIPVGQTFLVVGYGQSEGEVTPALGAPVQDVELTIDGGVAGIAHTFDIAGESAKIDMLVSRQCLEGSATFQGMSAEARRCGYGDPTVRVTWNFYGAPALSLQEFGTWDRGLVIGTSLLVGIPVGTYKPDKLVNIGTNRWMVRPELGMSYNKGQWNVDVIASVSLYQDNDDFFQGFRVKQDPVYGIQSHLVYNMARGSWVSLNVNFFTGGETNVNGIDAGNEMDNSRLGVTYSQPLTRHQSIRLYGNRGVLTRFGNDFNTLGLAWQYRF